MARLHDRIARVLGLVLPTEAEENANPQQAESLYDDAVAALRELTRDRARFRLVFAENAEYGFRRNTFGIKWLGVTVSAAAIGIGAGVLAAFSHDTAAIVRWGVPTGLGAACAAFWLLVVTPDWVRRAAEIYADRLFEAVVALAPPPSA